MRTWGLMAVLICAAGLAAQPSQTGLNQPDPVASAFTINPTVGQNVRGYRFQVNASNVTVTHLGCFHPNTTTTVRTLSLWNFTTQALLAQVVSTPGPGWCWTAIPTPVQLTNGLQYIVTTHSDGTAGQGTGSYYYKLNPGGSWQPTGTIQYMDMRYAGAVSATTFPTSILAGYQYGVPDIGYSTGPGFSVTPIAGTHTQAAAADTGPGGNGIQAGRFTIASNSTPGAVLQGISLQAAGSGDDSTAYTQVAVYRDANANNTFDFGTDVLIQAHGAFPSDNGVLSFTLPAIEQSFGPSQTSTYLIVVKMAGPVPATNGQLFNFVVSDLTVPVGTSKSGTPSAAINGIQIVGPTLTPLHLSPAPLPVLTVPTDTGSGNGILAGTFNIFNNSAGPAGLNSITLTASGTGNDAGIYTEVAVFEDTNTSSTWESGVDVLYAPTAVTYPADNGSITFTAASPTVFAASENRRYFVVVKLNGPSSGLDTHTLRHGVSGLGVGAGTAVGTIPSAALAMPGITLQGPHLQVAAAAGVTQQVQTTETGPGGNGRLAGSFTVGSISLAGAQLASVTLRATGSGADHTAYTQVALYYDANDNGTFEFGTDALYGTAATAFPVDNGDLTFTMNQPFGASEVRRYLIVCKFGGTPATNTQTFNFIVQAITVNTGTQLTGFPSLTLNGFTITGPVLTVAATAGATQNLHANATGPGSGGINAGTFTISNSAVAATTVTGITLVASGSGNDLTGLSSVQLFEDTNNNSVWDGTPTDAQVGATLPAYSADNGTATFALSAAQQGYAISQSKRYFVVIKLNGATLASVGHVFNSQVQTIAVGPGALPGGTLPSTTMLGVTVIAPSFAIADVPVPPVTAYRTLGDYVLQRFTLNYPAGPNNSLAAISLQATGSGNDAAGYAQVRLFHDVNDNGVLDTGIDVQAGSVAGFSADNGSATFSVSGAPWQFVAPVTRSFLVVGDFNNTPAGGSTFQTRVAAAPAPTPGYAGTTFTGLPTAYGAGATVVLPQFVFADTSAPAIANAFMGDPGFVLEAFTVEYPSGPANVLGTVTIDGSGTGNDLVDISGLHLYLDDPLGAAPGSFDAADTLVDSQTAFNADNGQATFNLTGLAAQFAATDIRQFFVIVDFNQLGTNATTFSSAVTAAGGMNFGGQASGLPLPASAGLNLLDANIYATFHGPSIAVTVNSDSQGINDEGHLICDVSLATGPGSGWNINALTFIGTGTADHATAYSSLWLHEDNGNGTWDGPNLDSPAASPLVSFNAGTFDATFDLLNTDTGVNATRRYFLLGRLAGTATSGQTLNARLESVAAMPDIGGSVRNLPLVNSTALIIEQTAITVLSGPGTPADLLRKSGTAFVHPVLNVRLGASNNDVTVSGITFDNSGTGNFAASLPASGFQVWLDDGDGLFTAADSLLFQGAGASSVTATFATPVTVPNSDTRDLWVVLDVLATAGNGAAVPLTFQTVINAAASVNVPGSVSVLFGTPAPQSNVLRLVDFFVSNFDPAADLPAGGRDITITGSGFMAPIIVMIDGNVCPGTAVINAGTQVTGIQVPPGSGFDVAITIKSGQLATETLTQTFDYVPLAPPKAPSDGGCTAASGVAAWWLALAALPLATRLRRRK